MKLWGWRFSDCISFRLDDQDREERGISVFDRLKAEIDSIMERDPAARSRAEVYFLYSGFKAGGGLTGAPIGFTATI